jgi:hypothetical protein
MARLWALRAEGVKHRNKLMKPDGLQKWTRTYEQWRQQVLAEAKTISANLEAWLETLDRMGQRPKGHPSVNEEHERSRRIMSEIMFRMEEFLKAEMLNKDIARSED